MNKSTAKKIRAICPPVDKMTRNVYRRLKKSYAGLSKEQKKDFFLAAKKVFGAQSVK